METDIFVTKLQCQKLSHTIVNIATHPSIIIKILKQLRKYTCHLSPFQPIYMTMKQNLYIFYVFICINMIIFLNLCSNTVRISLHTAAILKAIVFQPDSNEASLQHEYVNDV